MLLLYPAACFSTLICRAVALAKAERPMDRRMRRGALSMLISFDLEWCSVRVWVRSFGALRLPQDDTPFVVNRKETLNVQLP